MSRGPLPSKLCLLSSLADHKPGDKVRFLGCVTSYDVNTASLVLGHPYPRGTDVLVAVSARLVLETMQPEATRVGEWVNVLGYVQDASAMDAPPPAGVCAFVEALMVWPTGPLDVRQYEKTAEDARLRS
ncbi:uncharacterized protein UV8b_00353 [Ustilaginoidea virens]|uniref:Telomere length regulation/capping, TEN1 n=1 Tax=Ustilaginoidea virens TaxID=1159556 RepID=A0A8E5ME06_USTVR|nr:uncharacterized protein UV8b_00353 [Ustilaginoidea virens]QUC16112.1 hypothetical protein UV8b_00353 [Ustilaginoidea virens]